jgi:hypothetical protein
MKLAESQAGADVVQLAWPVGGNRTATAATTTVSQQGRGELPITQQPA